MDTWLDDFVMAIFIFFALALLGWLWWERRVRATAIRKLAESQGFHYLGEALPHSLPISTSPFTSVKSVWNVIDGEPRGVRIVAFDCKFGQGRGSWSRTVVAIKTEVGTLASLFTDPELRIE